MPASPIARFGALIGFISLIAVPYSARAEVITWVGTVDSLWNTAANWSANRMPGTADDVVLDNSVVQGSYRVYLPAGNMAVSVRSLVVIGTGTWQIELILPPGNTAAPAFTSAAYPGISLGRGAVFCNASGASSGSAVATSDSLRLLDGGTFIQRSETAHAALVTRLAVAPSAREGYFEFNVPGAASYTVSVSNRTYGHLVLNASAAGGNKNYLSSGSNPVNVKGDLRIGKGVNFNLNSSAAFRVNNNADIEGNFNMSTGSSSNTVFVGGDLTVVGTITESGSGLPVIECNGSRPQQLDISGVWLNAVGLAINNPFGVAVLRPLTLSSKLILKEGKLLTDADRPIQLSATATIESDSMNQDTYIDGPISKHGLNGQPFFYFPVGKENRLRWLKLRNASGDYTVEFFKGTPLSISKILDTTLDHLSGIEYWTVRPAAGAQSAFTLSFDNVNSGGVTSLGDLRVACMKDGKWENAGNTGTSGTAGSSGSVTSDVLNLNATSVMYLTLASASNRENPLPVYGVQLRLIPARAGVLLNGNVSGFAGLIRLRLESSTDNKYYRALDQRTVSGQNTEVSLQDTSRQTGFRFYRLVVTSAEGKEYYSRTLPYYLPVAEIRPLMVYPVPADRDFTLRIDAEWANMALVKVFDEKGRVYITQNLSLGRGSNCIHQSCAKWPPGIYAIQVSMANGRQWLRKIQVLH